MTKHLHFRTALCTLIVCTGLGAVHGSPHKPAQRNPELRKNTEERPGERQFFGPLAATGAAPTGGHYSTIRPLWLRQESDGELDAAGQKIPTSVEHSFLYPLFSYKRSANGTVDWSLFKLVNFSGESRTRVGDDASLSFELWPVYASKQTGTPETSYRAVFPIAGQIKSRFGYDSLQWVLFPLSFRSEKAGRVTHSALWPIFKKRSGEGHTGFSVWPLYGVAQKEGAYRNRYFLWPLIYDSVRYGAATSASTGAAPHPAHHSLGVLPFYAREVRPGSISESYLWPFFGYTRQDAPLAPYQETRYLWPLFVQGQGSEHRLNRWAPFYSHSVRRGIDKRWFLWPLLRHETWREQDLIRTKDQVLFFLYSSERQRSAAQPDLPAAHKTHLWPLLSTWNNGAGRAQTQLLSPLAVFFPNNEKVQLLYNPLFALYRHDQQTPDEVRHEVLWRLVTWRRSGKTRELRILGPTLGLRKNAAGEWRPFLFDFSRKSRTLDATTETPAAQPPRAANPEPSPR
ncbi:hypothetical protein [Cephaloticoccus capnophilus]|nr:hypothetical protein [Cephaloticoccus capnophilus]